MANEIEHKYLIQGEFKSLATSVSHIVQGYICSDPNRTVRIRIRMDKAYLTIKGPSSADGLSRYEFEKEISIEEAQHLMTLCECGVIDKNRYLIPFDDGRHVCEVDEFFGDNEGLVLAEVEVASVDETFDKPSFLGREVTGDKRYYNSQLRQNPFRNWSSDDAKVSL